MNITRTEIDTNEHRVERRYNQYYQEYYNYYNVDAWYHVNIHEQQFLAIFQTGQSFIGDDYTLPSNELELSGEGGTHPLLLLAANFDAVSSDAEEQLEEAKSYCAAIDTVDKLLQLQTFLNENNLVLEECFDTAELDKLVEIDIAV